MISVDTNVLVRFLADDDPKQDAIARQFFKAALVSEGIFISAFVLVESAWILRGKKISRTNIHDAFLDLINTPNICVSNKILIESALIMYANGKADFCDYVLLLDSKSYNVTGLKTFDKQLQKEAQNIVIIK